SGSRSLKSSLGGDLVPPRGRADRGKKHGKGLTRKEIGRNVPARLEGGTHVTPNPPADNRPGGRHCKGSHAPGRFESRRAEAGRRFQPEHDPPQTRGPLTHEEDRSRSPRK